MALGVLYSIDLKLPAGRFELVERMRVKGSRTSEKLRASVHFSPLEQYIEGAESDRAIDLCHRVQLRLNCCAYFRKQSILVFRLSLRKVESALSFQSATSG